MLCDYFQEEKPEIFRGIRSYDYVFMFECREYNLKSFRDLILFSFPKLRKDLQSHELIDALKEFKVLFLVDGIDEINSNSKYCLEEVIEFVKETSDSHMLVTSRPNQVDQFTKEWKSQSVKYVHLNLEGISGIEAKKCF